LYPENHPLNISFDDDGICSGCRIHEEKDALDWRERLEKLKSIAKQYRSSTRNIHDCIVPVSGARDSYFIVHFVKNVLQLHPLLVTYNKHYNTRRGIRNQAYLQSLLECDIIGNTVSPEKVKKITKETLRLRGSMYWHCIAGQTVFPVRQAVGYKIPLVIWGAHQGVDQVGMFSHLDEVEMTRKYRKEHDLMGLEAEDLAEQSDLTLDELEPYLYPNDAELASVGVRGIYLNNYIRWDSKAQHEKMIKLYGYETAPLPRTFDTYNDVDCFHYAGLHDYIKFIKYGYGKVTDHATREIRLRRMTREAGIEFVRRYQFVKPQDTGVFCEWLGMTESELFDLIEKFRGSGIWRRGENNVWELNDSIVNHQNDEGIVSARLSLLEDNCDFIQDSSRADYKEDKYVLLGKGWVNNDARKS
jgi:N-acetyl sugar amidotransferase